MRSSCAIPRVAASSETTHAAEATDCRAGRSSHEAHNHAQLGAEPTCTRICSLKHGAREGQGAAIEIAAQPSRKSISTNLHASDVLTME